MTACRWARFTAGMLFTSNVHQYGASMSATSQIPSMVRSHSRAPAVVEPEAHVARHAAVLVEVPEPDRRQPPHERARAMRPRSGRVPSGPAVGDDGKRQGRGDDAAAGNQRPMVGVTARVGQSGFG